MHQGWPKLVSHLWYATAGGGLAAVVFGPCRVTAMVRGDVEVAITEETAYPFGDRVRFLVEPESVASFPFHIRIPGWCKDPLITINGAALDPEVDRGMAILERTWKKGDLVEVQLPMEVRLSRWVENSVSVERGPLVYVLRIGEEWKFVEHSDSWGDYYEVRPADPWNYGLLESAVMDPGSGFEFLTRITEPVTGGIISYPWNLENAPVELRTKGKIIPDWQLYRNMAGPLPHSLPLKHLETEPADEIILVPYGCSTLRITEFPVVR